MVNRPNSNDTPDKILDIDIAVDDAAEGFAVLKIEGKIVETAPDLVQLAAVLYTKLVEARNRAGALQIKTLLMSRSVQRRDRMLRRKDALLRRILLDDGHDGDSENGPVVLTQSHRYAIEKELRGQ